MIMTDTVVGKVRSIGVSNFSQKNLEEILLTAEIFPAVNQVNFYFGFDVHSFIKSEQLEVHAYNPEHSTQNQKELLFKLIPLLDRPSLQYSQTIM